MPQDFIKIRGARVHNLKNINLDIPKNKLVVVTGLSGSGKSSLAFDTLYAEGQRRYVESLSAYVRQFLGVMDKPDVDRIEGLSPAIAIDQRSVSKNPRSTVGTITEIYDYLRLLFSRVGKPFCPQCGEIISRQSQSAILEQILKEAAGAQILVLGPQVSAKKGEHRGILEEIQKAGFVRVRVDGTVFRLEEALQRGLDKKRKHNIEVVVDSLEIPRAEISQDDKSRLADSLETGLKLGKGMVIIKKSQIPISNFQTNPKSQTQNLKQKSDKDLVFSELFACKKCGLSLPEIEPRLFSFNSPFGACPECQGLGSKLEIDQKLVIPNPRLTLAEGAIRPWATASHRARLLTPERSDGGQVGRQGYYWWILSKLADEVGFSMNTPVNKFSQDIVEKILRGSSKYNFEGVIPNLERRWRETESDFSRAEIEKYMLVRQCPLCLGGRLKKEALAVKFGGINIVEVSKKSVAEAKEFFQNLKLTKTEEEISRAIVKEILRRLQFLIDVGLDYLTVDRSATTLSGGEAQRIRLATQIGSGLSGVIYILDEPSVGLHQRDLNKLIETLKELRDLGNSVIVVEHDEQTIKAADWVIDIGPGAGKHGGKLIFEGTPAQVLKSNTLTGEYLSGRRKVMCERDSSVASLPQNDKKKRDIQNNNSYFLEIIGASEHNLKNINVKIPLGFFVAVTGVSGSGKSTLVNDILGVALARDFHGAHAEPGRHREIKGAENLDKVIIVDQSAIGRTPRSNPATYTGAFTPIREIFSQMQEARVRGYNQGRFSFNVKGGRCEACEGDGVKKIEMYFLPDVYVECEECHGRRYNSEALEIEYKGKNIADVLDMSIDEAYDFFKNISVLETKLGTLKEVGLGYMKLGQGSDTLSGGEAQRIKLATELARRDTGRTLYILDEPTTGLHFDDIKKLLDVLHTFVGRGNTVLVIEHQPDVIASADWVVDLGPEGGEKGGYLVAEGKVSDIIKNKKSYTGRYLKKQTDN